MSVTVRVRALVTYREWLGVAQAFYGEDWEYACQHYAWHEAFNLGWSPQKAVRDCKGWLYSQGG